MGIMFSVVTAAFSISSIQPHLKAMTEGEIAGKLAFDIIDHIPDVQID